MAEDMEDITPTNDGGILKKILHSGVGSIVPPGASVEGADCFKFEILHNLCFTGWWPIHLSWWPVWMLVHLV